MAEKKALPVRGSLHNANQEGFEALLKEANRVYDEGLLLVAVVNVGPTKIGSVFVRMPEKPSANLFGD